MVGVEVNPCMEAVKFQLNIRQKIFVGELVVLLIFVLYPVSLDLLLGYQLREFPIYYSTLHLIPQQQVIPLKPFLSCKSHPLLRGDTLVIIFQHLLADHIADRMDDVKEVIVKLVLALHLFDDVKVAGLSSSFYEDLREFMKLDALVLLLQRFQTVPLLNPLYFLVVISADRQCYFFNIPSVHDRILGSMEIDDVVLYLREELANLKQLRKDALAQRGGLADAGFIILPQEGNIPRG